MNIYELVGVISGLLCVWLTVRQNIWCWPTGILSAAAFGMLFFQIKLYADLGLQVFFIATSIQGWYYWLHGGQNRGALPITTLSRKQIVLTGVGLALAVLATGYVFDTYTDAHIPFWDASASGMSVAAQVLLMRKKLENWALWIAVDVLSTGIYVYKAVYLTAGLYVLYLILAISGLIEWKRAYQKG